VADRFWRRNSYREVSDLASLARQKETAVKHSFRARLAVAAILAAFSVSSVLPAFAYHEGELTDVHQPAHTSFDLTHRRTDQPVIDGVDRTWIWGPEAYTEGMLEPYTDSPGGMRLVQYYDKSRMELNNPSASQDELWYVTNGLLVIDMIEGRYQIGDAEFDMSPDPAEQAIAGDQDGASHITYAAISEYDLRNEPALPEGTVVNQTITETGEIEEVDGFSDYGVTAGYRVQVPGIDHTVASVFWEFMNSEGLVYDDDWNLVTDKLFENPFYATGYPITEAYWVEVNVAGTEQDVLWQCFERRCLTYNPANDEGWMVEAGNVGQHYFTWRYGPTGPDMEPVEVGVVALEDDGVQGPAFGCDDSLVMVPDEMQVLAETELQIRAALQRLFVYDSAEYYNVFFGKNILVEDVTLDNGVASLYLIGQPAPGGVCDDPRIEEQLRSTATQFDGVDSIIIYLNGEEYEMGEY
jgi:hypothetical protein